MVNINSPIHEPKSLGVRQLPDDIESVILQPGPKVAYAALVRTPRKALLQLLEERDGSRVDQRLEGNEGAHRVGIRHRSAEPGMELLIGGVKKRLEGPAVGYCLLHRIEVRLKVLLERVN